MTYFLPGTGSITDECRQDLKMARGMGVEVLQKASKIPGHCANCGGAAYLVFGFCFAKPTPERMAAWQDGQARRAVEVRMYPCPVCNAAASGDGRVSALLQACGVDGEFKLDFIAADAGKEDAYKAGLSILAKTPAPSGWFTFHGPYGVGKSGVLKSLVLGLCHAGVEARYTRAVDIIAEIHSTFGNKTNSEEGIIKGYGAYQFLAIDEVDRTGASDWEQSRIMAVLDDRYNSRYKTCTAIATNKAPEQLSAQLGYLANRMTDGLIIKVGGVCLRG